MLNPVELNDKRTKYFQGVMRDLFNDSSQPVFVQETTKTSRKTMEFGYVYQQMKQGNYGKTPIPAELKKLYSEARELLIENDQKLSQAIPETFNNCILSLFQSGDQLQPHIDDSYRKINATTPKQAFYFANSIVGVIVKADKTGGLYLQKSEERSTSYNPKTAQHLPEQDGTIYHLSDEVREKPWQHGVSQISDKRISVTFRTADFI